MKHNKVDDFMKLSKKIEQNKVISTSSQPSILEDNLKFNGDVFIDNSISAIKNVRNIT